MESKPQKKSRAITQRRNKQTVCVSGLWRELTGGTAVRIVAALSCHWGKFYRKFHQLAGTAATNLLLT